jgi:hypothetical protein
MIRHKRSLILLLIAVAMVLAYLAGAMTAADSVDLPLVKR